MAHRISLRLTDEPILQVRVDKPLSPLYRSITSSVT
jgi:hypothetical protein